MKTKKLLGTTLALAMILPSFANAAELLKNLKLSGQIDLQSTSARNITDFSTRQVQTQPGLAVGAVENDRISTSQTRLMLGLDWDLLDDVHAKVSVTKNDRTWGAPGGATQTSANSQAITSPAGTSVLGNTFVDQAYFKVDKVFGSVDTTIGRQYYGTSGDLIIYIGPSDKAQYGLPTTAVDAARLDWSNDMLGVTALAGKFAGNAITTALPGAAASDRDLTGFIATLKGNDTYTGSLYTWNVQTHGTGALGSNGAFGGVDTGKNDNLYITGAKVKLTGGGAWFKGEFAKNWGDNRAFAGPNVMVTDSAARYKGWAVLADIGYKADVSGAGSLTGWGNFGYGTGQHDFHSNERRGFVAVAGDYRPGSIYGRFAPSNGAAAPGIGLGSASGFGAAGFGTNTLTNRVITGLGIKINPDAVKKLTIGLSMWDFHTQTGFSPVNPAKFPVGFPGTSPTGATTATGQGQTVFAGNKHIGYESDIDFVWKHSDNVTFAAGAGRFMPGGIIYEANQSTRFGEASQASNKGTNPALMAYFDARVKF